MQFKIVGSIRSIQLIAAGRKIRHLPRLQKIYGRGRWRKLKGIASIEFPNGTIAIAEVHWYEAHGIGKKEFKIKRIFETP